MVTKYFQLIAKDQIYFRTHGSFFEEVAYKYLRYFCKKLLLKRPLGLFELNLKSLKPPALETAVLL